MKSSVWANLFIKHYAHITITVFIALFDLGLIHHITLSSCGYVDMTKVLFLNQTQCTLCS